MAKSSKNRTKKYRTTLHGTYVINKYGARRRGLAFKLSFKLYSKYWQKPCWYCGYAIKKIGLDRIDSSKGYYKDNIRSCCRYCNAGKSNLTTTQFLALCSNVVRKHGLVYGRV